MAKLVYYVSGHGLGHAARALGVVNALPAHVELIVCTASPLWFWQGEATRPFQWRPLAFDCGAVQADSLTSDGPESLKRAAQLQITNSQRLLGEVAFLRSAGATGVVCDIPPFPLQAAAAAGVPGVLICNFTWAGIYEPYVASIPPGAERRRMRALVQELVDAYREATLILQTPLSMDLAELGDVAIEPIPLVVRPPRPPLLRASLGMLPGERLVLISTGFYGVEVPWRALAAVRGARFVGFNVPEEARGLVTDLAYPRWQTQDVTAEADVVVAKAGYGTIAECMAGHTPLVHPPRPSFVEHEALVAGMAPWGGSVPISEAAFRGLDVAEGLARAFELPRLPEVDTTGAQVAVQRLGALMGF